MASLKAIMSIAMSHRRKQIGDNISHVHAQSGEINPTLWCSSEMITTTKAVNNLSTNQQLEGTAWIKSPSSTLLELPSGNIPTLIREEEIGRGNYGIVYKVRQLPVKTNELGKRKKLQMSAWKNSTGVHRALKVSRIRSTKLAKPLAQLEEFQKLCILYKSGVSVPEPHGFITTPDPQTGAISTGILMEYVNGCTLRDWINSTPGHKDLQSNRTIHPVKTPSDAILRLSLAISLVNVLAKMDEIGFCVDLKPPCTLR